MKPEERLIVALDVPSLNEVERLVYELSDLCYFFKVGPGLFIKYGPKIIEFLKEKEKKVFLDLKLNDIPNTTSLAMEEIVSLGVDMTTVHILGGKAMLEAVSLKKKNTIALGVSVLTSLNDDDLRMMGFSLGLKEIILNLANLAKGYLNGIVCSPSEAGAVKDACGKDFFVVCPGIRLDDIQDDQKRKQTPDFAIKSGCDYIIVGRPIIKSSSPSDTAKRIIKMISQAS
ncbi:TPA: orotidine-5'-phosphate decarboxylase [bacterium]|nr:orotidine-5'-phosphate decarboxylase [bacterium]